MRSIHSHVLGGVSLVALSVLVPGVASAQTPQDQSQAEACANLPSQEEREACLVNVGDDQSALPEGGAPAADAIIVTGSRIARPNFDTLQPSVIIDAEQIENRGFETLGQAINEQPTFGVPGSSPVGGQAGSFGSGQSFVNFLGLGSQRTLILVNGRRFVSSNTASIFGPSAAGLQVDLNTINTRLVERIETIAVGGAPIYGSDAIAGTVNIILRDDFEGIELDGQYGISEYGDAPNYRIRGIAGMNFDGGRGNVTITGEYNKGEGLLVLDRPEFRRGNFYARCNPGSQFTQCLFPDRRIPYVAEGGVVTVGGEPFEINFPLSPDDQLLVFGAEGFFFGAADADGNQVMFDAAGNLVPIDFGNPIGLPTTFAIDFSGGNGFNLNSTQQLLTDTERYNATLLFDYDVTDNIRLFAEGWYSYSSAVNLRDQPVYNSGIFDFAGTPDGPIIVDINNPFLTDAQRELIQTSIENNPFSDQNALGITQDYFYLGRANTDLASGRASSETEVYRGVLGLDGSFDWGWRSMNWQIVGNYGRAESEGREPVLVQQNFENAVNAVRDASGNIVCAPGAVNAPIPTLNSTCAPLNLFGVGRLSQAARDYVTAIGDPSSTNEQWVVTASVAGPIMELPGGSLSVAVGYEHRYESTDFDPGAFYFGGPDPDPTTDSNNDGDPTNDRVQFGRSIPIFPVSGSFNTDEIFGEITAEIIGPSNGITGVYRLEVHGAARYVDHSTAGGDLTWTVEGRYAPVRDIAFRGNFTRAIRSPAITELFNPSSDFFGFATDPCDADNLNSGPDPATRQANCAAAGVPTDFQSLSDSRSFNQALAGNVALDNEKSDAWSVGVVLTPRWVPNLRVSADWVDIKLEDAISSASGTSVLNACYDDPNYPNNDFCDRIRRDFTAEPTSPAFGQVAFITTSFVNQAELRYKGLLGALDYRVDTPFLGTNSRIGVNLSYQYLDTLTTRATPGAAPTRTHGTIGYPRHSAVLNLNYENGPALLFTSLNYTGPVDQFANEPENFREFPRLNDNLFVNAGVAFSVNDRMRFRFIVDNVFDADPPFPVPAAGGSVTYFPGVLGRYYRFGASFSF